MNKSLLSIENLSVDFESGGTISRAVNDVSLKVSRREILAIVGESGSGKSVSSLSILQLLPKPPAIYPSGRILFTEDDHTIDLLSISGRELQSIRGNKISMIFQEPMTSLNPVISCGKQVLEAIQVHNKLPGKEGKKQVINWFTKVKLPNPESIYDRYPHELSGGQKQRVMIAMAMCCHPSLLICDEPTTALDVTVQKTILELIKDLQQEENMGVIFITHDLGVVAEIADRVAIMYKGEIVEEGPTGEIFKAAKHSYTKALIACKPSVHKKGDRLPVVSDFLNADNEESAFQGNEEIRLNTGKKLLEVKNLVVEFPVKKGLLGKTVGHVKAVDGVSFDIYQNETLGLVGESGCGKTTLGRTLLRLIEPSGGEIIYNGTNITTLDKWALKGLRRDVQLVFQDPYSSLNPRLTIGAAIAEPMAIIDHVNDKAEKKKRVSELLDMVNLSPSMANRYPHEFSGGQRQRIVIARALSLNPDFLVCDESVSALDVSVQAQVLNLLNDLKKQLGLTMLFISHDLSVVRYMCDRIMVMKQGQIIESGPAEEVYESPKNEYTRALIDAIPAL